MLLFTSVNDGKEFWKTGPKKQIFKEIQTCLMRYKPIKKLFDDYMRYKNNHKCYLFLSKTGCFGYTVTKSTKHNVSN